MNGTEDHNTQQAQPAPPQQQPQQNWQPPTVLASTPDPRLKSPLLAMLLSCMPGLGQVYVGYYQRGFIHILVVGSLIAFLNAIGPMNPLVPMAGFFLAFFWLYNIVDAGRRAALYNQALAGTETIAPPEDFKMPAAGGSVIGGICLIGLGAILLSNTLWDISLAWVEDWWPVALFIPGVWLIVRSIQERTAAADGKVTIED